jgi:hypothetical protein
MTRAIGTAMAVLSGDDQERLARLCRKLAKGIRAQVRAAAAGAPATPTVDVDPAEPLAGDA